MTYDELSKDVTHFLRVSYAIELYNYLFQPIVAQWLKFDRK